MTAIAYYLLKMLICSGILTGYYYASLQNKLFHQWNRFYLLLTVVFSITFPLLYIPIFDFSPASNTVGQMVYRVSSSELQLLKGQPKTVPISELLIYGAYSFVVFAFLLLFILSLYRIYLLKRRSTSIQQSHINIYQTNAQQAPFSFFKNIFWKQSIDIQSTEGQQILKHELVHVHEKHSVDKVFVQLVLSAFWINPFFWLIKKELTMIHEFIADKKSVGSNDASVLASLILTTAYSSGRFDITNQFFQSSIKRRITMISQNKDPRFSYLRRIAALFVLLTTLGMLAFRAKNTKEDSIMRTEQDTAVHPTKAIDLDWFKDSDTSTIIFTIDKKRVKYEDVKDLTTDQVESVHSYAEERNGNKVIMVDLTLVDPKRKGSVSMAYPTNPIYYIDGKEASKGDLDKIEYIKSFTVKVWKGEQAVQRFGAKGANGVVDVRTEKTGKLQSVNEDSVLAPVVMDKVIVSEPLNPIKEDKFADTQKVVYTLNHKEIPPADLILTLDSKPFRGGVELNTKAGSDGKIKEVNIVTENKYDVQPRAAKPAPLWIVDGKEVAEANINTIDPSSIKSMSVWKGAKAIEKYGEKGRNGVIEIVLKKTGNATNVKEEHVLVPVVQEPDTGKVVGKFYAIKGSSNDTQSKPTVSLEYISGKPGSPLYIVDGKEVPAITGINPDNIDSITVWKDAGAIKRYGDKGKNGVIDIRMKKSNKPATLIP
jgi:beta-lactamase regulating signal transducer with metallopeptidase domain